MLHTDDNPSKYRIADRYRVIWGDKDKPVASRVGHPQTSDAFSASKARVASSSTSEETPC